MGTGTCWRCGASEDGALSSYGDPRDAEIARLNLRVAEQTARAERAEAEAEVRSGRWCEKNRNEGRGGCGMCGWCCKQSREDRDLAIIEAARRTTERDAALAACAEMRAALEGVLSEHEARVGECNCGICYPIHALLKKGGG